MDEYQERYLEHIKNKLKRKQTKHTYAEKILVGGKGWLDRIFI